MSEDYWMLREATKEFEDYWNVENRTEAEKHWHLVERLAKGSTYSTLLDVGCGIGNLITFTSLASKDNYLGIDISPPMVERARVLHPGYRFEVATPIEFADGTVRMAIRGNIPTQFDLVVANGFLLHQHDLFLKLHRLTKLTKSHLIFNVMVTKEGYSRRDPKGYWTRVLGAAERVFMKRDLEKEFRLEEVKFGEWGDQKEYYFSCQRSE